MSESLEIVHVGIVDHKHGKNVYVGEDAEALDASLYVYVTEWWSASGYEGEPPEDHREAIEAYFTDHNRETLSTYECEVGRSG